MRRFLLALVCFAFSARAGEGDAWVSVERARIWRQLDASAEPFGLLRRGTPVKVLRRSGAGNFLKVEVAREGGRGMAQGFVLLRELSFDPVASAPDPNFRSTEPDAFPSPPAERHADEAVDEDAEEEKLLSRPWSAAAGFSGYSGGDARYVTVSADIRYLWAIWTETLLGADLAFGDDTKFGVRLAQRLYAPTHKFRPFVHAGWRVGDVRAIESAAWEPGAGFQLLYGEGASFFEAGVYWLWRTPFDDRAANGLAFGGSGGVRF